MAAEILDRIVLAEAAVRPSDSTIEPQPWSEISLMPEELRLDTPIPQLTISLMGTDLMGEQVYLRLKAQGHKFQAIFAPPGEKDRLRKAVQKDNEEFDENEKITIYDLTEETMKDPETVSRFSDKNTDLGVFASVTYKAPEGIYNGPKKGTIGIHDSYLDEGRGGNAAGNAIRKRKKYKGINASGVTVYGVVDGEDEGDKFFQARSAFWDNDTPFNWFPESTVPIGSELMANTVEMFARGMEDKIRTAQDLSINKKEALIEKWGVDWNKPSEEIFAELRGTLPYSPYTVLRPGEEVDISEHLKKQHPVINLSAGVAWLRDRGYKDVEPGTIVEISDEGITVATIDGGIRIKTLQSSEVYAGPKTGKIFEKKELRGSKAPATEYANAHGISVGDKFVSINKEELAS